MIGSVPVIFLADPRGVVSMFGGIALLMYSVNHTFAHKAGPLYNTEPLWGSWVSGLVAEAPESCSALCGVADRTRLVCPCDRRTSSQTGPNRLAGSAVSTGGGSVGESRIRQSPSTIKRTA